MVASAVRMRTPSAMFLSKGALSLRRPQAVHRFKDVAQSQLPSLSALSRYYASKSFPPHTIISMPALSPTMLAGNIGAWQKKAGDSLQPGDVLVEIETDKAQMDFEFQEEGVLAKVLKETGEKEVSVGAPIAVLVEEGVDVAAFEGFSLADAGGDKAAPAAEESKQESQSTDAAPAASEPAPAAVEPETSGDRLQPSLDREPGISPAAKALALEKGVPIKALKGTGRGGQITKEDVEKYKPATAAAGPTYEDIPLTSMRKTIAARLQQSTRENPHFFVSTTLSVSKLLKLRQALNASADGKYKLSVNDFLVKACAAALMKVPAVNSSWREENGQVVIRQHNTVDISVAVATPAGLITPVVKDVQGLGLSGISNQIKDLGKRARDNKLKPEEYQGGTFTISNMGMNPAIERFTAVINPPQAGILAVGTTRKVAVPVETEEGTVVEWDDQIVVTGSFDHKVVDGAVGGEWIKELKKIVENPLELLLRAPDVGGIYRDESESTASLVDVDSPHVQAVDAEFLQQDVKTTTQAERIEREEEAEVIAKEQKAKAKARAKAKAKASSVRRNTDNPVYIGNALILALAGAGLGYGAYRKHAVGQLSWELVGWASGAVGAFGAVDYFVSKTSQIAASLASLSRTVDDYSALSKKELILEKQEKAFDRVKNFRSELADYRQHFDRLRKEREDAQSVTNRNELLGRRPHHTATPENPYAQSSLPPTSSAFGNPSSRAGLSFGASPADYTRETHALREQSFLSSTSTQLDEFLDRGRAVLTDLGQQREVLKGTQRRLYSVANTLGVSGETIRRVERRAKQDKWIFWGGVLVFFLFCWGVLHFLR
ncbi:dihydrolipoamide acetyltransferase component of pyruvate dehydrogenase [Aspergillus heteromorphus CBS 117.55]|uniref:Acetyltransferase component of pyruvate dehydrogenase complex n=1 Tax=Aspergillus heteromorphus CBS 117.55 TaxID=1448321 RepID=A0A317WZ89_9EURO|nr:dihydrolipoamide acetyltransferase component of pyruvate dehydrogenase [Aspergillus heteromorphus CBS 117.55]PWY90652.1 dihydrolipoamide acetyltransferase component of pyruvate dehydrogenase [Aspergillus heteromorphus CBS 117.55]